MARPTAGGGNEDDLCAFADHPQHPMAWTDRPLVPGDGPLLEQATLGNLNWREQRFTGRDVEVRPEFRHYAQMVRERGDFGFVAERGGEPIGVVWAQLLPAGDPGYGFVDESTPEVSLWVREDSRGQGVGKVLLRRLQREAIDRRWARLSLSVEAGNQARRLYASEGFEPVAGREADGVMVWHPDALSAAVGVNSSGRSTSALATGKSL
jgi:GNAT superfamily N-acetyltransferase